MPSGSRFAVAVHVLSALGFVAKEGKQHLSSSQLAKSVNTHPVVIRNLIRQLKRSKLVISKEGKCGGIKLAKLPSEITLMSIFLAVNEASVLKMNKNPEYQPCPISRGIKRVLPEVFEVVDQAIAKTLKGVTLQDIVDQIKSN